MVECVKRNQERLQMDSPPPDQIQTLINWLFTAGGAVVAGYTEMIRRRLDRADNKVDQMDRQIHQQAVILAGDYVKRAELDSLSQAIFAKLDRIENKIDQKADKHD